MIGDPFDMLLQIFKKNEADRLDSRTSQTKSRL